MTNEQAIDVLNMVEAHGLADEAKKLAIKALQNDRPQGEYKTACNVLLSLEQIVRKSDGWEDSAVEAVHNAVQTAIKCMHERPQGEWIKTDGNSFECPFCHRLFDFGDNYCGFCGADMRKGGTE